MRTLVKKCRTSLKVVPIGHARRNLRCHAQRSISAPSASIIGLFRPPHLGWVAMRLAKNGKNYSLLGATCVHKKNRGGELCYHAKTIGGGSSRDSIVSKRTFRVKSPIDAGANVTKRGRPAQPQRFRNGAEQHSHNPRHSQSALKVLSKRSRPTSEKRESSSHHGFSQEQAEGNGSRFRVRRYRRFRITKEKTRCKGSFREDIPRRIRIEVKLPKPRPNMSTRLDAWLGKGNVKTKSAGSTLRTRLDAVR